MASVATTRGCLTDEPLALDVADGWSEIRMFPVPLILQEAVVETQTKMHEFSSLPQKLEEMKILEKVALLVKGVTQET